MKKVLKIFNGFFNEKNESIEINSKVVMVQVLQLFLGDVLKGLKQTGEEERVTKLVSIKSVVRFLSELESEELIVLTLKGIQDSVQIF